MLIFYTGCHYIRRLLSVAYQPPLVEYYSLVVLLSLWLLYHKPAVMAGFLVCWQVLKLVQEYGERSVEELPPYSVRTHEGYLKHLTIRSGRLAKGFSEFNYFAIKYWKLSGYFR